jgi:EmrB/QacA subfamily drug resistance transporter
MNGRRLDRRWLIVLLVSVGEFMAFLDAPVVTVALPDIGATFADTSDTEIAWVLDGYFIAFAAPLLAAGKLADRFGRRRMFIWGLMLFTAASVLCGAAPSIEVLIAGRVLQGIGAAMVVPAGQGLMLAEFPPAERKTAIGVLAAVVGLATSISPAIGGVITDGIGWEWIFYVNLLVGIGAILWAASLLPRDQPDRAAALPDGLGAVLSTVAIALVCLAMLKRSEWGLGDARTLAAVAFGALALAGFVGRQRRHRSPVLDLRLFRDRTLAVSNASSLVFAVAMYGSMINSVFYLGRVWDYSALKTGFALLAGSLFGALWGKPAGSWTESHGPRPVAIGGSVVAGLGALWLAAATGARPEYVFEWLPGALALGAGAVIALTALIGGAVTAVRPEQFGVASGLNSAVRQVGGALGVALVVGILSDATPVTLVSHEHTAFAACAIGFFLAALAALPMPARLHTADVTPPKSAAREEPAAIP